MERTGLDHSKESSTQSWIEDVVHYVFTRQNKDGGYNFCRNDYSNAQDTYHGLAIVNLLKLQPPQIQKTIDWLLSFVAVGIYSHYYLAKALEICGENPDPSGVLEDFIVSHNRSQDGFGTTNAHVEAVSGFKGTFMVTQLINMLDIRIDKEKTVHWLLTCRNTDGGFGAYGLSDINSTYHAVASLHNLGYPVKSLGETLSYVRSCERPSGGFTLTLQNSPPHMEQVYCGISALDLMGKKCRYPEETADFVMRCRNQNGGFARSEWGISTLEDTFYALNVMQKLDKMT
nr:prenyltransferase/squalene oxidase repeat-containing protein [Candidatus Njordarchaeum guaymaensis]